MKPFPRRTVLLMALGLLVFVRLWWITHGQSPTEPPEVHLVSLDGGFGP